MTTSKEKSVGPKSTTYNPELLVEEFYNLRKAFEADYSGQLRSHKYEETREFTISLNYAIFQANQLLSADENNLENVLGLEAQLENLRQGFLDLIQ